MAEPSSYPIWYSDNCRALFVRLTQKHENKLRYMHPSRFELRKTRKVHEVHKVAEYHTNCGLESFPTALSGLRFFRGTAGAALAVTPHGVFARDSFPTATTCNDGSVVRFRLV